MFFQLTIDVVHNFGMVFDIVRPSVGQSVGQSVSQLVSGLVSRPATPPHFRQFRRVLEHRVASSIACRLVNIPHNLWV